MERHNWGRVIHGFECLLGPAMPQGILSGWDCMGCGATISHQEYREEMEKEIRFYVPLDVLNDIWSRKRPMAALVCLVEEAQCQQ